MLELRNVSKIYGKKDNTFTALKDVNLHVATGQVVAIVGKSGSGKSTLMHLMSGLDKPSEGQIIVNGRDINTMKAKAVDTFRAKQMSFIFQSFFVEANQTVYQNVMLPLEIAEVPRKSRKQLVMQALDQVGLDDKVSNKASNLSGGQKQRLAIARAVVNSPKLIFADEPTGNLDSATGEKIIELLFGLNKKMGSTLIIVTHDTELAARCTQQIHIHDGEIVKIVDNGRQNTTKDTKRKIQ